MEQVITELIEPFTYSVLALDNPLLHYTRQSHYTTQIITMSKKASKTKSSSDSTSEAKSTHHSDSSNDPRTKTTNRSPTTTSRLVLPDIEQSSDAAIDNQVYYHGFIVSEDINDLLREDGDFLVCSTNATDSKYVINVMFLSKVRRYEISHEDEKYFVNKSPKCSSVVALVDYFYSKNEPISRIAKQDVTLLSPTERQLWQLNHEDIKREKLLGEGNFGEVWKGKYKNPISQKYEKAAIKTCKQNLSFNEKRKFIAEGRLLRRYKHPNVVRFYGLAAQREPLLLVMELISGGSLIDYLKLSRNHVDPKSSAGKPAEYLRFLHDAAMGMEYLEKNNCIHRDLAARNCLLDNVKMLKIADFGMSREQDQYLVDTRTKIPIRWCAYETIVSQIYTTKCDVWSYAVLMYEVYSEGNIPYCHLSPKEVMVYIKSGNRLKPAEGTPPSLGDMMVKCMDEKPDDRPTFAEIKLKIEDVDRGEAIRAWSGRQASVKSDSTQRSSGKSSKSHRSKGIHRSSIDSSVVSFLAHGTYMEQV